MVSRAENLLNYDMQTKNLLEVQVSIASEMLDLAHTLNRTGLCGKEESSPFCHDAMYRAALIFGQSPQSTAPTDSRKALDDIRKGLKTNNRRWKAAGKRNKHTEHSQAEE